MNQEHFILQSSPIEAIVKARQSFLLGLATDPRFPPPVRDPDEEEEQFDGDEGDGFEEIEEDDIAWLGQETRP